MYADTNTTPLCSRPSKNDLQLARFFVAKLTSLLVYANPKVYFFFSLVANILGGENEEARTRTLERDHDLGPIVPPFSIFIFSQSFLLRYVHRRVYARVYIQIGIIVYTVSTRVRIYHT